MVVRKIPPALENRLMGIANHYGSERRASNWQRFLMRLPNFDARRRRRVFEDNIRYFQQVFDSYEMSIGKKFYYLKKTFGVRVRSFDVSRSHPEIGKVVLKVVHGDKEPGQPLKSQELIDFLDGVVSKANSLKPKGAEWIIEKPFAIALNDHVIAMASCGEPTAGEMLGRTRWRTKSRKGVKSMKVLQKRHPELALRFRRAVDEVSRTLKMGRQNFLFGGVKNGKFVFVPLMDKF